jgi:Protein of unknown function (DUF4058)
MPLLDHFHPPLYLRRRWGGFHSSWATFLAVRINQKAAPLGYIAETHVKLGIVVESDVGVLDEEGASAQNTNGTVATAVWAPPQPPYVVPVDLADLDVVEIQVFDEEQERALVAAVELVSPANKDRPAHRQAFVTKCAAYLQQQVAVVVVDVVTNRQHNFHRDLMETFGTGESVQQAVNTNLYAVAYRTVLQGTRSQLEVWPVELILGAALPTLPLWLNAELAVPLELEASYQETCRGFAIEN